MNMGLPGGRYLSKPEKNVGEASVGGCVEGNNGQKGTVAQIHQVVVALGIVVLVLVLVSLVGGSTGIIISTCSIFVLVVVVGILQLVGACISKH